MPIKSEPVTPAFEQWFSDSKVVNEKGKPLRLYHSTHSDISVPKVNFGQDEWKRFGMHVGSLEAATSRLDLKDREDKFNGERSGNAGANIMPVYVMAKGPLRLTENRTGRWGVDDVFGAIIKQAESGDAALAWISPQFIDDFYSDANVIAGLDEDLDNDPRADVKIWQNPEDWEAGERSKALVEWLATAGIDSIVYDNEFEGGGDSYIIFNQNQIKSAIGNNGDFSPTNNNITQSPSRDFDGSKGNNGNFSGASPDVRFSVADVNEVEDDSENNAEAPCQ